MLSRKSSLGTAVRREEELAVVEQRYHDGDPDAFAELVSPHVDALYTVCLRMTSNPVDAEEIAQETLARALDRHHLYRVGSPIRPWILAIAANLCRSRMRSPWWRRALPLFDGDSRRPDDRPSLPPEHRPGLRDASDPESRAERGELDLRVRTAMGRLPPIYREALALFYLDDMSYAEMTEVTGVAIPALKQRVRRGRDMLKDAVVQMYPDMAMTRTLLDDEDEAS